MVLGKVIKLDYKNRCHLPLEMMEAAGIATDSEVEISCIEGTNEIFIRPRDPQFKKPPVKTKRIVTITPRGRTNV